MHTPPSPSANTLHNKLKNYSRSARNTKLILFMLFYCKIALAQVDSTKVFESSKGSWDYPIAHCTSVSDCQIKSNSHSPISIRNILFETDSAYMVSAVFEGKVVGISKLGDTYIVITRFGNYFLSYVGLEEPALKKGDYVTRGQEISRLRETFDTDVYRLEIVLSTKTDDDIFPCDWFHKPSKQKTD